MKNTGYLIFLCALPICLGLILSLALPQKKFGEVLLLVVGCIELIIVFTRAGSRERKNKKTYGRYASMGDDEGFRDYKAMQRILLLSALFNLAASFLLFKLG